MEDTRPWYKKKRYIGALAAAGFISLGGLGESTPPPSTTQIPIIEAGVQSTQKTSDSSQTENNPIQVKATTNKSVSQPYSGSNADYYTNVDGNRIQSPTYYDSAPAGASAQCGDGTYSFSQHHQGTCSHHGGVAEWL